MKKNIKICYIGGGSKLWAQIFMSDLALSKHLEGEIALYDIDFESAYRNKKIGDRISLHPSSISKWKYNVYETIDEALKDSAVVIISILPGTMDEMYSDVHTPEKYGIFQSVGDTVGPGGVIRAMRTIPIYEGFAKKIKEICPSSWVINLTNPMTICVKALFDVFPSIKAFGCCHEVFHTQDLLIDVARDVLNIKGLTRKDISFDVSGINHFTWIKSAKYKDIDLLDYLDDFFAIHKDGYFERGNKDDYLTYPYAYNNLLKYDLYKRYGVLGAAGDRHLAEFLSNTWYLKDKETAIKSGFNLTTVDYRKNEQNERIERLRKLSDGLIDVEINKSGEEAVELIESLMGQKEIISNVNYINKGQVPYLKLNSVVESNCIFKEDELIPITCGDIPDSVKALINRNALNIETCYEGIKERDFKKIFASFMNQPLCSTLSIEDGRKLFKEMVLNTKDYLKDYYDLSKIDNDDF